MRKVLEFLSCVALWTSFELSLVNSAKYGHILKREYCYGEIESFIQDSRSCKFQIQNKSFIAQDSTTVSPYTCNRTCKVYIQYKKHDTRDANFCLSKVYVFYEGDIDKNRFKVDHFFCVPELFCTRADMLLYCGLKRGVKMLGDACQTNEECTGTPNGGFCRHTDSLFNRGKCQCNEGYTEFASRCLQENRRLHEHCEEDVQCNGTNNASKCSLNTCICSEDFIDFRDECLNYSLALGNTCELNAQCLNNGPNTHCSQGEHHNFCTCEDGYLEIDSQCLPGDLPIGTPCQHHKQCNTSDNDTHCSAVKICSCIHGKPWNGSCFEVGKILYDPCVLDEQCTGTENANVCLNGLCGCGKGFLRKNRTCVEVNEMNYSLYMIGGGGFLAGVLVTVIICAFIWKAKDTRRKNGRFDNQLSLETRSEFNHYSYVEHRDIRNQVELSSYHSEDQDIQSQCDTYNHLHERPQEITDNEYGFHHLLESSK